jgi:hypothetical protein
MPLKGIPDGGHGVILVCLHVHVQQHVPLCIARSTSNPHVCCCRLLLLVQGLFLLLQAVSLRCCRLFLLLQAVSGAVAAVSAAAGGFAALLRLFVQLQAVVDCTGTKYG